MDATMCAMRVRVDLDHAIVIPELFIFEFSGCFFDFLLQNLLLVRSH